MRLTVSMIVVVAVGTACGGQGSSDRETGDSPGVDHPSDSAIGRGADEASEGGDSPPSDAGAELFPDVVGVEADRDADGTWTFRVTLSSPYDTPQRYADAWRVMGPDRTVFGVRELAHDHAGEQPFTRSLSGVEIPDGVRTVIVEGRDQVSGWGGATVELELEPE